MNDTKPTRKPTRSKHIDYFKAGAYFVTICTRGRKPLLSKISFEDSNRPSTGAASCSPTPACFSGKPNATVCLSDVGRIAEKQLLELPQRFEGVKIGEYVIMPNHIHAVIFMCQSVEDADRQYGLIDVIRVYKSLTARLCKKEAEIENLFQRSYYDHFIRDKEDFEKIVRYIRENPMKWYYDELYTGL